MISRISARGADREAFVWIWLAGEVEPVVAGRLRAEGASLVFNYGRNYLDRDNAIAIYAPELPLEAGELPLLPGLSMPGCLRDAAPDAWGRRVLINRLMGARGTRVDTTRLDELTYLLESGSDRFGALDFQRSATEYVARGPENVSLKELMQAAQKVEEGIPLSADVEQALHHGTAIGGARPKALVQDKEKKYVAKFSSSTDTYSVVKAELVAMRLARLAGLDTASVSLKRSAGRDVLLVERFDRIIGGTGWTRRCTVSALTLFGLDELMARYASYRDLAEIIRHRFTDVPRTLRELFSRMVFNILCGNTDDHARNHAAFWDGRQLTLTPAYDICPQARAGNEASQAMLIDGEDNLSHVSTCLNVAHHFHLSAKQAASIVNDQVEAIARNWAVVCEEARLTRTDRALLGSRQFLNPFSLEGSGISRPKLD